MKNNHGRALTVSENRSLMKFSDASYITPFADIYETPDAFVVIIEMPGVNKDSISVGIEANRLTVKGNVKPYHADNANLHLREIQTKNYYRVFNLSDGIVREKVEAKFEDGVLTITLHKTEEIKPKEIRVR